MIDKTLGQSYLHLVCKTCKDKIEIETKKLTKLDLLFPRKIMSRFSKLLCDDCRVKVVKEIRKNAR